MSEDTAALMLTNPNTLGLFERDIEEIAEVVHDAGGLLYYDGANLNALLGRARPGDMGFDVMHYNVHKTFATPHGGGGPGAGPVGVSEDSRRSSRPRRSEKPMAGYETFEPERTIGKVHGFVGNWLVLVKAYAYIARLGDAGLADASAKAVLNANYLASRSIRDPLSARSTTSSSRAPATGTPPTSPAGCSTTGCIHRRRSGRRSSTRR